MLLAALAAATPQARPVAQPAGSSGTLLLAVVVNGRDTSQIGDFELRGGKLFAKRAELDALGFKVGRGSPGDADASIAVGSVGGMTYRLDAATQTVYFTAPNAVLKPALMGGRPADTFADLPVESTTGAAANYNVVSTVSGGRAVTQALVDTRLFSPWGVVTSSAIITSGAGSLTAPVVRLDSTFTHSDPEALRQYRAGDVITGGLAWTRPVRLGGLQVTTNFGIRPDLVTFPTPTITGQVAVPSSVDVLVNGTQVLSRNVSPGPFEIHQLPVVTGTGNVSVVVRDGLGQETTQTLPIYSSSLLLVPGLSAYTAELGALRLNYGTSGDSYRAPAAAFTVRHGLLDWLTLQGHAEGNGPGRAYAGRKAESGGMLGVGAAFAVPRLGAFSIDTASSLYAGGVGNLYSAAFERTGSGVSLSASMQVAGRRFTDIASSSGDPVPRMQARAAIGLPLGRAGSVGLAYVAVRRDGVTRGSQFPAYAQQAGPSALFYGTVLTQQATKVSLVSASFSTQVFDNRAYFYATGFHDLANRSVSGLAIGLAIPLGQRTTVGGSVGSGSGTTVQASRPANDIGDWGGRAEAGGGSLPRQLAYGGYKSSVGFIDAGFDRVGRHTAVRGSVQGALAYTGGDLFASNTIHDSFAIVDTGASGIHVLQENRPIGVTGRSGLMLVPELRSFDANRLGIDPGDVPLDAEVEQTSRLVRPGNHSGVVVPFPVRPSSGATINLVDSAGHPIPVGSTAALTGAPAAPAVSVGYDGQVYITSLKATNRLTVTLPRGGQCSADFAFKPTAGSLPQIGPVVCRQDGP